MLCYLLICYICLFIWFQKLDRCRCILKVWSKWVETYLSGSVVNLLYIILYLHAYALRECYTVKQSISTPVCYNIPCTHVYHCLLPSFYKYFSYKNLTKHMIYRDLQLWRIAFTLAWTHSDYHLDVNLIKVSSCSVSVVVMFTLDEGTRSWREVCIIGWWQLIQELCILCSVLINYLIVKFLSNYYLKSVYVG